MAIAIEVVSDYEFISDYDKDEEVKTTWKCRALNGLEWLRCTATGKVDHQEVIKTGLIGWSNFPDDKGEEIEYCVANISRIPPHYLVDIFLKINNASTMGDEERKN